MTTRRGLPGHAVLVHAAQHGSVRESAPWVCELYRLTDGRLFWSTPWRNTYEEISRERALQWLTDHRAHPSTIEEIKADVQ